MTQDRVPNPGGADRRARQSKGAHALDFGGCHRRCGMEWAVIRRRLCPVMGRHECEPWTSRACGVRPADAPGCESPERDGKLGICDLRSTIKRCARAGKYSPFRKTKRLRALEIARRRARPTPNDAHGTCGVGTHRPARAPQIAAAATWRPAVASRRARLEPTGLRPALAAAARDWALQGGSGSAAPRGPGIRDALGSIPLP
jgi:hypothetical protein